MEILGTTLRVCVDDLDRTVPFYERLVGRPAERFDRGNVS
ncbi:VOC family protein, partial [Streptomyces sp. SID11233]|nr:VOC family protein [Streptomyces sp. SID11233]